MSDKHEADGQWKRDLRDYREKHFEVKIETSRFEPDELLLHITHNGDQWNCISLLPKEARAVIEALQKHLREHQQGLAPTP